MNVPKTTLIVLLLIVPLTSACGRTVDLARTLELETVSSGWVSAGIFGGKTKLVPTISFTLKNGSEETLSVLQLNALFGRVGAEDEWGSSFVTAAGTKGLAPKEATGPLTVTSPVGYTGLDSSPLLLGHSQFIDARVDLFAKYGSGQWTRIGRYPIVRTLLAR
ncbi:MAG: hypothetical protein ABJA98_28235 [Acidobacteriota bacterium]